MTLSVKLNSKQYLMLGEDPPGVRLELVHGDIVVSPSPAFDHSFVDRQLGFILSQHINDNDLGELVGDVDTIFDDDDVRRPDIIFIAKARTHLRDPAKHGIWFPPDLCVEILSPTSADYDQGDKFELYAKSGVAHYWIVDPAERTFIAYRLARKRYVKTAAGHDDQIVRAQPFPKLDIPLARLWPRPRD